MSTRRFFWMEYTQAARPFVQCEDPCCTAVGLLSLTVLSILTVSLVSQCSVSVSQWLETWVSWVAEWPVAGWRLWPVWRVSDSELSVTAASGWARVPDFRKFAFFGGFSGAHSWFFAHNFEKFFWMAELEFFFVHTALSVRFLQFPVTVDGRTNIPAVLNKSLDSYVVALIEKLNSLRGDPIVDGGLANVCRPNVCANVCRPCFSCSSSVAAMCLGKGGSPPMLVCPWSQGSPPWPWAFASFWWVSNFISSHFFIFWRKSRVAIFIRIAIVW